jgi:hypothetical protein
MFGTIQLDISPRAHELTATDRLVLPNSLQFAEVPAVVVEIVDVHRHAAEKFHAMTRDFGQRENSRVRDLVDLVLLIEHEMLATLEVADAVAQVWHEREVAGRKPGTRDHLVSSASSSSPALRARAKSATRKKLGPALLAANNARTVS